LSPICARASAIRPTGNVPLRLLGRPSNDGRPIHREGAAFFWFEAERIRELWVLGDLLGLDALLKSNS
jgi:hypothetical protein